MTTVLPPPESYADLVPGTDSPVWRYASDTRLFAASAYALTLQVAHPTVGAGVADHSNFQADPWGRLLRTLDYVNGTIYGGPELAGEIGRRVREMHRDIKGVRPDGERYHAMDPKAYAWVHATLVEAITKGHEHFGRRLEPVVIERFYADWLRLGRLIGVREQDLPDTWPEFREYFDATVEEELVDNPTVHVVLGTLRAPKRPHRAIPHPVWRAARRPLGAAVELATLGLLGPRLRERLGLSWSPGRERAYQALGRTARAGTPVARGPIGRLGPTYVRARRKALERGDVARPRGGPVTGPDPG